MKKPILYLGLGAASLLFGCKTAKMQPHERFLALKPGEDRIVIASVIPKENDSTGTYVSILVFSQADGLATASIERLTPKPYRETRRDFFCEGLVYTDSTEFPAAVQGDSLTPAGKRFELKLYRDNLNLYAGSSSSHYAFRIRFAEQTPFKTQAPRTDFGIGGLETIDAEINKIYDGSDSVMVGHTIRKPSVLLYHTLENADLLLASREKTFYWIDFYTFDGTSGSVLFEKDAAGATNVLYSTLPMGEQLAAQLYYTTDTSGVLLVGLNSLVSDKKLMIVPMDGKPLPLHQKDHTVKTVTVTENNEPVGTGILYQL